MNVLIICIANLNFGRRQKTEVGALDSNPFLSHKNSTTVSEGNNSNIATLKFGRRREKKRRFRRILNLSLKVCRIFEYQKKITIFDHSNLN